MRFVSGDGVSVGVGVGDDELATLAESAVAQASRLSIISPQMVMTMMNEAIFRMQFPPSPDCGCVDGKIIFRR